MQAKTIYKKCFAGSAIALVLALFVACGGEEVPFGDAATVQPSATAPATAVPVAVATAEPEATATTVPTATREPTPTPVPAEEPERTASPSPEATPESTSSDAVEIPGLWAGISTIPALGELPFTVDFTMSGSGLRGTMDIPAQNAFGLELADVSFRSGRLHFELDSPIGLAIWDGELLGGLIEGEFKQAGLEGTFRLERSADQEVVPSEDPPGDAQYRREEIQFSSGDVVLAGDLTFSEGEAPFPAVVLISGSGGQDPDANLYGFKVFEVLTRHIVGQNIAVLRIDDRGTGGSSGLWQEATLQDRAADVLAAVALLQDREDIDGGRIGLVGHSEGGLVALIVASQSGDIAYLALLATPAVRGDELLRAQQLKILEVSGADRQMVELAQTHQELVLQAVATGEGWSEVEQSARELARRQIEALPANARESIADVEAYIDAAIPQQMETLQSGWFVSFVEFDPRPYVLALDIPVMTLFGVLDTQVPVDQNSTAMSEALSEGLDEFNIPGYFLESIWPANHLFQDAETGGIDEYSILKPEFNADFLDSLLDWLAERTDSP